jgi:CubicO group peptidase (beta-lactamase class C family)
MGNVFEQPVRPEAVLMDSERLAAAFRLLDEAIARGDTPGGVALAGRNGRVVGIYAAGEAHPGEGIPAAPDTIYDCASLTKVAATLPLMLMLVDRGLVRLSDPVAFYLPEFAAEGKESVTVKQLLTHTSGLPSYMNLHAHGWSPEEIKRIVLAQKLAHEPGSKMVYSDLGFIVLGELIAAVLGQPLDQAARSLVFEPLGMRDTGYLPAERLRARIAATEFRQSLGAHKWGVVHDENADAMGGVSGHAGLFSTAADLAKYACMWLAGGLYNGRSVLSRAAVETAVQSHTPGLPANRGLGWALKGDPWDSSGDWSSPASYGHTGFTGTSIWIDPARGCFAVLLTNRVYYGREKSVVRLRHLFHNAVAASCM